MKFPPRRWATGERNIRIGDDYKNYTHLKHGGSVNDLELKTVTRTA